MGNNTATVMRIYEAFQKGDVPAILAHLSDNVDWMNYNSNHAADAGIPWFVRRRGKAEVPKFFMALAEMLDFKEVRIGAVAEAGSTVIAQFGFVAEYRNNGPRVTQDDVHVWTFDGEGKVASYRHYTDTAEAIQTWNSRLAKAA